MRHIACADEACVNHGAAYFDFEPDETIVLCPVCEKAMQPTTLEQLAELAEEKQAAHAAAVDAQQEAEAAEAAANPPVVTNPVLEKLAALGDQPLTASGLAAILQPEDLDAHTADLGLQGDDHA